MSREVRRVPLDFNWPLNKVWSGYLFPERFAETPCPDCQSKGYSAFARALMDLWHGYVPFDPAWTGSARLDANTPAVRVFAERNVNRSPAYYGSGEEAIVREARRLAKLWNGMWCHHLTQDDVQALVDDGRLRDFTHTRGADGWEKIEPRVAPTAAEVNAWSLSGFGHDAINRYVVVKARCKAAGQPVVCATCSGHGSLEKWRCQRSRAERWEETPPPSGDGWQLWETVSEGSPITPVFATREELVNHLCSPANRRPLTRDEAEGLVDAGWVPSGIGNSLGFVTGEQSQGKFAAVVLGLTERGDA
ncbi:hypothetical protein [Nocardia farcinica]|uniref:hypothetical protein n=1 Tax=Nocardia farcinica TaxID=37329 RepID=UPI0024575D48|nr:hypothetical protein [Nocardia farcinica]